MLCCLDFTMKYKFGITPYLNLMCFILLLDWERNTLEFFWWGKKKKFSFLSDKKSNMKKFLFEKLRKDHWTLNKDLSRKLSQNN